MLQNSEKEGRGNEIMLLINEKDRAREDPTKLVGVEEALSEHFSDRRL